MRVWETDRPEDSVTDLKCHEEGDTLRFTFQWPAGLEQVYIFKTTGAFNIATASAREARLFTLQEYKKQAGFSERRMPGAYTYHIFPFTRADGEDTAILYTGGPNHVYTVAGQTVIQFSITEKSGLFARDKTNTVCLLTHTDIDKDLLCYVKKANGYPADAHDGVIYFFGEALKPNIPFTCQIKTKKNEYIRIFIHDSEKITLYKLMHMDAK